jgi:hypothetical protein
MRRRAAAQASTRRNEFRSVRQWAKREKQIEQVISNTAGMYGELQALTGLPDLAALTAGADTDTAAEANGNVLELPSKRIANGQEDRLL